MKRFLSTFRNVTLKQKVLALLGLGGFGLMLFVASIYSENVYPYAIAGGAALYGLYLRLFEDE